MSLSDFSNLGTIDPQLPEIGMLWLYQMSFFYTYFANTTFEKIEVDKYYCGVAPHKNSFKIIIGNLFVNLPSIKQKEGALIHEYLHIIMASWGRQGERDSELWNISTDYAINEEVLKHEYNGKKLELPPMVLLYDDLKKQGYNGNCIAEEIYDWIEEQCKKHKQQQSGQSGQGEQSEDNEGQDQNGQGTDSSDEDNNDSEQNGSGSDQNDNDSNDPGNQKGSGGSSEDEGENQSGENDSGQNTGQGSGNSRSSFTSNKNFDDHTGLDQFKESVRNNPITAAKVKKIFEQAQAYHEIQSARGIGSIAGSMYEFIKQISRPVVRWRGLLHSAIQSFLKGSGHKKYSWSKKNRKNLPFPGKKRFNKKVVLAVDTSGSISTKLAERFFSEIEKISQNHEVIVVQFDVAVRSEDKYKRGYWRKIKFTGRGGTSCKEVFDYIHGKKSLRNTVVVVFSDGGFWVDYDTYKMNVVWAICGSTDACNGKIVEIKDI